jgi:hypothetical protein
MRILQTKSKKMESLPEDDDTMSVMSDQSMLTGERMSQSNHAFNNIYICTYLGGFFLVLCGGECVCVCVYIYIYIYSISCIMLVFCFFT